MLGSPMHYLHYTKISKKMLQTIWNNFSVQFSLLFQMVCYILLAVLPFKTPIADWWKTFNSQSGSTKRMVLKCNTESKTEYTIGKSNENWTENWCQIVCSILFDLFDCMTSSGASNLIFWNEFKRLILRCEFKNLLIETFAQLDMDVIATSAETC